MTNEKCMLRDLDLSFVVAGSIFQWKLSVVLLLEVLTSLTVSSSFFIPCCDIFFSQFDIKTQVYVVHFYTQVLSEVNWLLIYLLDALFCSYWGVKCARKHELWQWDF